MKIEIEDNKKHTFLFNSKIETARNEKKSAEKILGINKNRSLTRLRLSSSQPNFFQRPKEEGRNEVYRGGYINNKKHGRGRLVFKDGEYEGEFKNDLFDGEGVLKTAQFTYSGSFSGGKKNGVGIEKYADGTEYRGTFKEGVKDGQGILKLNNGAYYRGSFSNDKLEGFGRLWLSEEKEYAGQWRNNELSGFGSLLDSRVLHVGFFRHSKKSGVGASFFVEEGYIILGTWRADVLDGFATLRTLLRCKDEKNNNIECTIKFGEVEIGKEKIIMTRLGEIVNVDLDEEEEKKVRRSNEYKQLIYMFNNKIYPEFLSYRK